MKFLAITAILLLQAHSKPIVWIYTDMSDKTIKGGNKEGTVNDPDDISAMAGYLLMANEFDTRGIVVASTHRKEHKNSGDQAEWANDYFGKAYTTDLPRLNRSIGGYPETITFTQSCIKERSEHYVPGKTYNSLKSYPTIQSLLDLSMKEAGPIYVLCWGSLTEPAILVNHCIATGKAKELAKLRFIPHWTASSINQGSPEHPENVANCREDAKACAYMKSMAKEGIIAFHECGSIGQSGIVSGATKDKAYWDQFRNSALGKIFVEGKFVHGNVDHSDSATYWVLLGGYGVDLKDIPSDSSLPIELEKNHRDAFKKSSMKVHDELLRRAKIAAAP
jgi:hypothetical protein